MGTFNRRTFLQASGLAVAALASPRAFGANERIRVGIIGCRNRGHQVALSMAQSGRFELAALADCDTAMFGAAEKELAGHLSGHKTEQDFRRVLENPDIQAVVIATPDHWHAAMTALALEAGKHVYCEKPAAFNVGDAQLMRAAMAKHPQLTAVVGTQQRSGQHFQDARAFIREGGLGKVAFVRTWITHRREQVRVVPNGDPPATLDYELWVGPAPFHPYNEEKCHYNWHFVKDWGTGEMGNWGAHWLDIAAWTLDLPLPNAVSGHGGQFVVADAKETPDTQTVLYEFPDVTLLWEQRLWTRWGTHGNGSGVEFIGDKGAAVVTRGGWTFTPDRGKPERHETSEMMLTHVANFADAIAGTAPAIASLTSGLHTSDLCSLGNMAVESGKKIRLSSEGAVFTDGGEQLPARRDYRGAWRAVQERYEA